MMSTNTNQARRGRKKTILRLLPIFLALFCQAMSAATYYVAPGGSDSNPGSLALPVRTLQRGVDLAGPGDTVIVRDGTYYSEGAVTCGDGCSNNVSPVVIRKAGNSSAWITIKAENKWKAVLDCELKCDSYINLASGSGFISIENFVITRGYWDAIHSNDNAHDIRIIGNRMENIGNRYTTTGLGITGMYTNQACYNFVFDGNVFTNIGRTNMNWLDHGLYLHGSNFTITNNIFYNMTRGWAIQLADGLNNTLIANNTFAFPNPNKDGHIMMWNTQTGLTIRNNIFYSPRSYAIDRYASSVSSCSIDNNIVYGASGMMSDQSGCSVSTNRIGTDPKFVNCSAAPYDFHIQAGAPPIDTGATVAAVKDDFDERPRPQGSAMDVGAYEYGSSGSTPTPVVTPPVISGLSATNISAASAVINWNTDKPADSYVEYGTTTGYGSSTPQDMALLTQHSVSLANLSASTLYHYRVRSRDSAGNASYSGDNTFATGGATAVTSISVIAASQGLTVVKGQSSSTTVTAKLLSGNSVVVGFGAANLPAGVTASFSTPTCAVTCSSTITVTASSTAGTGTFNLLVGAGGSGVWSSATIGVTVGAPATTSPTSGLAAYWKMDENSGSTTGDSSGNGNTGTLSRAAWTTTRYGTYLWLDGGGSNISVQESPSLQMTNQMTFSAWIYPNDVPNVDERIAEKLYDWDVKLNTNSHYPQLSAGGKYAMMNYAIPLYAWRHVVFTYANGVVKGYVNGAPVSFAANTFTSGGTLPNYQYGLKIGSSADLGSSYRGYIDDVRLYNRALSDAEVMALYTSTQK